jgi:hypothetical protein
MTAGLTTNISVSRFREDAGVGREPQAGSFVPAPARVTVETDHATVSLIDAVDGSSTGTRVP